MKFIELTKFIQLTTYPNGRVLINTDNISSIYQGRCFDKKGKSIDITCIQETTSSDNYWEVMETVDDIVAMLKAREEK